MSKKNLIFICAVSVALLFMASTRFMNVKEEFAEKLVNYADGTKVSVNSVQAQKENQAAEQKLTALPQKKYIKMLFLGDIMMGRYVRTLMEKSKNLDYPFLEAQKNSTFLQGYFDRVIANLEGPIVPIPNRAQTGTNFGFAPDTAEIVKRNGIDLVSIANNHTLDQGQKGYESTKKYLNEAELPFFGHPILPTEADTYRETIDNKTFAFVGFHDATRRLDDNGARALLQKINPQVDYLIVFVHWGPEYQKNPSARQQQLAHLFIDSGADLVIGHHPHIPQTRETYNGVPIIYSLGNFIFDQYWSDMTQHGLTVEAVFSTDPNDKTIQIFEHPIDLPKSQPRWKH